VFFPAPLASTGSWSQENDLDTSTSNCHQVLDSHFKTGDDGIVFASGNTNPNRIPSPGLSLTDVLVVSNLLECIISYFTCWLCWAGWYLESVQRKVRERGGSQT
jgi:hypothetical protein